jgi:hypothetical protein
LFDHGSGLLAEPVISPLYTGDITQTPLMHRQMQAGDLMVGDDAFSSWGHFALILRSNLHLLTPAHHQRIVDFTPHRPHASEGNPRRGLPRTRWIKSLGEQDQLVEWFKPRHRPDWIPPQIDAALPESIVVREIRRTLRRGELPPITVTVVTTLLDQTQYPADELVTLRMCRWDVETDLRHLKTTMGMEVLHCKSVDGVQKEVSVFVLVYNLVRALMLDAARRQKAPVSRISFADALAWLRTAGPNDPLPSLLVNPYRPHRIEPRALKRRGKSYDLLNRPRDQLRQALRQGGVKR